MAKQSTTTLDVEGIDNILATEPERVEAWLDQFVENMVTNIKLSFGTGPSGKVYTRGSIQHVASVEGNPPNVDTGALRASIRWEKTGKLERTIMDGVEYGLHLEDGTEDIGARPFFGPEFADARQRAQADARKNLNLET